MIPIWHILDKIPLSDGFANSLKLNINDYGAIFQMKVHVLSKERFGAVQTETFHRMSPVSFILRNVAPALPADGQFLTFKKNIELNVLAATLTLPWILAVFHQSNPTWPPI